MNRSRSQRLLACAFATAVSIAAESAAQEDAMLAPRARGLLTDRCFRCHGPDERARKAELRLDLPEALAQPELRAELLRRVHAADPSERMPPPASHLQLGTDEIALLERWIERGARYERHWSYRELAPPRVPEVRDASWPRDELDRFVLAPLEAEGRAPTAAAPPAVWLRRVSFDLTGLPPIVSDVRAFLADSSDEQRELLVEKLLGSPAAAEHMAAHWLDLARYGDTFGYQSDVEMEVWPWRDWVLRAFEANLPYDQFVTWQLAGDLLPNATEEQITATAFNRLHRQTNEGGSIDEEFRVEYVADRVVTAGTAFMGLTLECARCHDHKYDPISQRDFYGLSALFQNIDESGLYSHFTRATPAPAQWLYEGDQRTEHAALLAEIARAEARLVPARIAATQRAPEWLAAHESPRASLEPIARFSFDAAEPGARRFEDPIEVEGRFGKALRFDGESGVGFGNAGEFRRDQAFSLSLWLSAPPLRAERMVVLHRTRAGPDAGHRGYEITLQDGLLEARFTHFWPGNALGVRAATPLPERAWSHVALAYDGSSRANGLRLWIDGEAEPLVVLRDRLTRDITYRGEWGDATGEVELALAARFRDLGLAGGAIDELAIFDRALTDLEARRLAHPGEDLPASDEELAAWYAARVDPEVLAARSELDALRARENELSHRLRELMVMREDPVPKSAHVLVRGAYDQPGEPASAGFPREIFASAEDLPQNRLGLARWLTHPRHPLTARVAANRLWTQLFGRGLCATPENFGLQGHLPENAPLLDYLATELVRSGFDQRAILKRLVLSATYAQSSIATSETMHADPQNTGLARGPSRPLAAEELRDAALCASGLLVAQRGGPSVKPYQPAGLWEDSGTGKSYAQDHGEALYRRSLYTFWRRTMPPPGLSCFDAPTREVARARREPTQTPLQALVLLNDPQFVEAARVLAEDLLSAELPEAERIAHAFERVLTRAPNAREASAMQRLLERERAHYAAHREAAEALRRVGEKPPRDGLDAAEVAAWTVLGQALFNHAEFRVLR